MQKVFSRELYNIKIVDGKYETIKLKNKANDKQPKKTHAQMSLEHDEKKEPKSKDSEAERVDLGRQLNQKTDEQPDTTGMPNLESEKSAVKRRKQKGVGLKILTPSQMLSRLPISLAQLKTKTNSEKRENEIRQLLYSLYRSKTLTKNIYKSLVGII